MGNDSPESAYLEHMEKFSQFVGRFYKYKPEIELLAEILIEMCEHSLEMANQFEQIKTLRSLIPICPTARVFGMIRDTDQTLNHILRNMARRNSPIAIASPVFGNSIRSLL